MTKLQISMPEPVFRTTYRVIYGDTDAGNVVYNANYLRFFEIGRTEMMRQWVIPYSAIEARGLVLPVTESYLRYKAPARYDELLAIDTALVLLTPFSSRFNYKIFRLAEDESEQFLVKGFTVHACVNRQGKLAPFPEDLVRKMEKLCHSS